MANVLFLANHLPYPPGKSNTSRSCNLLNHLLKDHRVFLGTFTETPEDDIHVATLRGMCSGFFAAKVHPRFARLRSLNGLLAGEALTLRYYRDAALQDWVDATCKAEIISSAVIVSSPMMQYIVDKRRIPVLVDFVDVASLRWTQSAHAQRWPISWLYRREGKLLFDFERHAATQSTRSFFASPADTSLFSRLAPECAVRLETLGNGINADYFSPDSELPSPYPAGQIPLLFSGPLNHRPNIDALIRFVCEVLPALRQQHPKLRLHIVGYAATPEVLALAGEQVEIKSNPPDLRPYLQHAFALVAPSRSADTQYEILQAMAMECAVITTGESARMIDPNENAGLIVANKPSEFVKAIDMLLTDRDKAIRPSKSLRNLVLARYDIDKHLSQLDPYLSSPAMAGTT